MVSFYFRDKSGLMCDIEGKSWMFPYLMFFVDRGHGLMVMVRYNLPYGFRFARCAGDDFEWHLSIWGKSVPRNSQGENMFGIVKYLLAPIVLLFVLRWSIAAFTISNGGVIMGLAVVLIALWWLVSIVRYFMRSRK